LFHVSDLFVKSTSSFGALKGKSLSQGNLLTLLVISVFACFSILLLLFLQEEEDPYINKSLNLHGSIDNGSHLFRMNCVGCHGISAQGLVGPELNNVTEELNDKKIINQVVKGLTPPMPSFEMDEQSMADLLAYLHSLNG